MKGFSIGRRERRVLVAGGSVIIAILVIFKGLPAWRDWQRDAISSAAELAGEVARAEGTVSGLQAVVDSLEAKRQRFLALAPLLAGVESQSTAISALAALVSGKAQAAGARVAAIHVRPDTTASTVLHSVAVRAELESDVSGVASLLTALESGPMLLAIREIAITQPEPAAPADRPEALRVELLVEALAFDRTAAKAGK